MSVAPVTPVESVNLQSLTRQSREAAEAMAAAIMAGDMAAAQRYLMIVQDVQAVTGIRAAAATEVTGGGERRTGLGALIAAVQAGDMDRARSVVGGKTKDGKDDTRPALAPAHDAIAAPKVVDASNAGTVLIDLSARLNAETSGARSAVEIAADNRNASGVSDSQETPVHYTDNGQKAPGPGEEENGNTRFTGEAIRSREEVLHSYSQNLAI